MDESSQRSTWQDQQETLSRLQFAQRLMKFNGWYADLIIKDLGEDFLVRIYEKGVFTGLSFFVQLKSTTDIEAFRLEGNVISYNFEVKDLIHWSASAVPVFLIVWDVTDERQFGYWITVLEAIAWLNESNIGWSERKKVRVWIPLSNKTDNLGLERIRQYLANYFLPSMLDSQALDGEFSFSFPDTPKGVETGQALQRFFDTGDPVQIDKEFIKSVRFSDWYTRIKGNQDFTQVILKSTPRNPILTRVDVLTRKGAIVSLPYIEFRVDKRGAKEGTISNKHQPVAVHIEIIVNLDVEPSLNDLKGTNFDEVIRPKDPTKPVLAFQFGSNRNQNLNVQDIKDAIVFFEGLFDAVSLRLTTLSTGNSQEFPAPSGGRGSKGDPILSDLINKLCFIQYNMEWSPKSVVSEEYRSAARIAAD